MLTIAGLRSCKYLSVPNSSFEPQNCLVSSNSFRTFRTFPGFLTPLISNSKFCSTSNWSDNCNKSKKFTFRERNSVIFCSRNDVLRNLSGDQHGTEEIYELSLLKKPSRASISNGSSSEVHKEVVNPDENESLTLFMKFFKIIDSVEDEEEEKALQAFGEKIDGEDESDKANKLNVEYYEPKPGDVVVGVVVSGDENKLDINMGADLLGTMLTKEVLRLYDKEMEFLDLDKDAESFMVNGKMGLVKYDNAVSDEPGPGQPIIETGTVLFAEVLGRRLGGRPLLTTRRLFRWLAWHRVRQIKRLNEPIEVRISEWNAGGLLTRIEGLRAFIPKGELLNRANNFTEWKEYETLYLREGTLLDGTVTKIFPFGAQIRIGDTNRRIADLESEPGLFISNKEKVFSEAKIMAKKYRQKLPVIKGICRPLPAPVPRSERAPTTDLPFEKESSMYANWKWFEFERE
ncbi:hypothetical protein SDJN02_06935, partial [Cucurbita argyrosperma subsp. argyrosperma]